MAETYTTLKAEAKLIDLEIKAARMKYMRGKVSKDSLRLPPFIRVHSDELEVENALSSTSMKRGQCWWRIEECLLFPNEKFFGEFSQPFRYRTEYGAGAGTLNCSSASENHSS